MNKPGSTEPATATTEAPTQSGGSDDFQLLREILFGTNIVGVDEVQELKHRVEDEDVRAEDVGAVLPRAIVIRAQKDGQLASALRPTIENTLDESVRKNPEKLVDVIFPILGPSIRKMVTSAVAGAVGSVNRAVESAFTVRGLKWRIEAWRTGRSYAEIALSHGVVYRVEQIFLIDRDSGLLLSHVAQENEEDDDPELISSMLTAIRDFVRDSFDVETGSEVDSFRVGDLTLMVETGRDAVLAAVVRGIAPPELRPNLQNTLAEVHKEYGTAIRAFEGDMDTMAGVDGLLEPNLLEKEKEKEERPFAGYVFWTLVFSGLLAVGTLLVMNWIRANQAEEAVDAYVATLRGEPGIVVTRAALEDGRWTVEGLRDPLAQSPQEILAESSAAAVDPVLRFDPYQSLEPSMVERRVVEVLDPPATVDVSLDGGVVSLVGRATDDWVDRARDMCAASAGVSAVDLSKLVVDERLEDLAAVQAELLDLDLPLTAGDRAAENSTIGQVVDGFKKVRDLAGTDARVRYEIIAIVPAAAREADAKERVNAVRDRMRASGLTVRTQVVGPDALSAGGDDILVPRSADGEIRFRAEILSTKDTPR